jgi:hypothetical protein
VHPKTVCRIFLKDGKCIERDCSSRHPNKCKYLEQGCNRGDWCDYLHFNSDHQKGKQYDINDKNENENVNEKVDHDDNEVMENDNAEHTEINEKCANCQSGEVKNQCDQCEKYFCTNCELKVQDASILDLYKSYQFVKYTCNTVHLSEGKNQ